jgi:hypothetical protein
MNDKTLSWGVILSVLLNGSGLAARSEPLLVDHTCTDITRIPQAAILQAKDTLHIAYGHTSHGSQIVDGMTALVAFANGGGKGLALPQDIFAWNDGGAGGALDLRDRVMAGDVGYYPDWVDNTHAYLDDPRNAQVNVIIWSWCGQAGDRYSEDRLFSDYLDPMGQLEAEYPHVVFVYMTGHVDHDSDVYVKAGNQVIRDYCRAHNKVLYDFADIESYDPDGVYYPFPDDSCDYYDLRKGGTVLGNWARQWQDSHALGVDWYTCNSAHSEPLNANQKAYAAWWLFARLAGWLGPAGAGNSADLNGDGQVNTLDLAVLSQHWLEGE